MNESLRYIGQVLGFVLLIVTTGTAGYLLLEDGLSVGDAIYMAVTAITPVHFDEIRPLSMPGRYFTVLLVFCGFGAVVAFATQFARLVIQSELEGVGIFTRGQMRRRIGRMKQHYIVCGFGEIGGAICGELQKQRIPFVVVTADETQAADVERAGYALVKGHATADASLRKAGIERATGVIAVLPVDADNLFISLAARELNPTVFIIARGEDSGIEQRILRAGADIVVSPMKLGGRQIAQLIRQQTDPTSGGDGTPTSPDLLGLRFTVYRHSSSEPKTVAEILQSSGACGAAGLQRQDGSLVPVPTVSTDVRADDAVILINRAEHAGGPLHKSHSGRTILLADDHRALRLLFARKLASAGHSVLQAADGDAALTLARTRIPDLVVLDVNMPKRNGYDVCAALRQCEQSGHVPIILYSSQESDDFQTRGKAAGADLCIRKTSRSSELLTSIDAVFDARTTADPAEPVAAASAVPADLRPSTPDQYDCADDIIPHDEEITPEVIEVMLEETPRLMREISDAIAAKDCDQLERAAHTLKGSLMIFNAPGATGVAALLETAGKQSSLAHAADHFGTLQQQVAALIAALERHLTAESRAD